MLSFAQARFILKVAKLKLDSSTFELGHLSSMWVIRILIKLELGLVWIKNQLGLCLLNLGLFKTLSFETWACSWPNPRSIHDKRAVLASFHCWKAKVHSFWDWVVDPSENGLDWTCLAIFCKNYSQRPFSLDKPIILDAKGTIFNNLLVYTIRSGCQTSWRLFDAGKNRVVVTSFENAKLVQVQADSSMSIYISIRIWG